LCSEAVIASRDAAPRSAHLLQSFPELRGRAAVINCGDGAPSLANSGRYTVLGGRRAFGMPYFDSGGVRIHYEDQGEGAPVILVHGFGTDARAHWGDSGLIRFLATRYRVIAPDARGHGRSDKPHSRDHYGMRNMCGDIVRLLDHLGIRRTLLVGYSMGSRICLELLYEHPEYLRAVVLGGFGANGAMSIPGQRDRIAAALLADDPENIADDLPRRFRRGVESSGNDLKALAACMGGEEGILDFSTRPRVKIPLLFLSGTRDRLAGDPHLTSGFFEDSRVIRIEDGDHMSSPKDPRFHEAIGDFLAHAPA
jgi:pimeloyl-ACP methyl ester carboxylesterase